MRITFLVALITFVADQILKWVVVVGLNLREILMIEVWPPYFTLSMAWNQGVNFGLFADESPLLRWVLILLPVVVGGSGDDHISTASGRSVSLYGAAGNDTLIGGSGPDLLEGGPGRDFMSGQAGNDVFQAQDGEIDAIDGGSGSDTGVFDDGDLFTSVP